MSKAAGELLFSTIVVRRWLKADLVFPYYLDLDAHDALGSELLDLRNDVTIVVVNTCIETQKGAVVAGDLHMCPDSRNAIRVGKVYALDAVGEKGIVRVATVLFLGECDMQTRVQERRVEAESTCLNVARRRELDASKEFRTVTSEEANTAKCIAIA
jgi:hypothetical protein